MSLRYLYVQITTRCNMACSHCIFGCGPRWGSDMDPVLWRSCLDIAGKLKMNVWMGGGEPTLHPMCARWTADAVCAVRPHRGEVGLVTNGSCGEDVWNQLMTLRKARCLVLNVSRSPWHDASKVDAHVSSDADRYGMWWPPDEREVAELQRQGRAVATWGKLERDLEKLGLPLKEITDAGRLCVRVDASGTVWADHPGGGRIGRFSEEAVRQGIKIADAAFFRREQP